MCPSGNLGQPNPASTPTTPGQFCTNGVCTYTPLEPLPGQPVAGQGLTFAQYVSNIFTLSIVIGAMVAVAVLVFSGITYMVSEALPSKDWGKRKMKQALWALLILLGSYLILSTINPNLVTLWNPNSQPSNAINPLNPQPFIQQSPSAAQLQQQTQCPGACWNTNLNPPACSTL